MSVICQNFVQNAWKKDLCSNCFKSVGDHCESVTVVPNPPTATLNDETGEKDKKNTQTVGYVSQAGKVHQSRNDAANISPHTTWKSLTSDKNVKNSQPFKLETGFRGRLLTINNVSEKNVKSFLTNGNSNDALHDKNTRNGNGEVKAARPQEIPKSRSSNSNSEMLITNGDSTQVQGILKKSKSIKSSVKSPLRINVGFKEEEPIVIGYGGRDFTPEELDWEMASDWDVSSSLDNLDETEEDKVISKITQKNTEFNSDTSNLLHENRSENNCETKSTVNDKGNRNVQEVVKHINGCTSDSTPKSNFSEVRGISGKFKNESDADKIAKVTNSEANSKESSNCIKNASKNRKGTEINSNGEHVKDRSITGSNSKQSKTNFGLDRNNNKDNCSKSDKQEAISKTFNCQDIDTNNGKDKERSNIKNDRTAGNGEQSKSDDLKTVCKIKNDKNAKNMLSGTMSERGSSNSGGVCISEDTQSKLLDALVERDNIVSTKSEGVKSTLDTDAKDKNTAKGAGVDECVSKCVVQNSTISDISCSSDRAEICGGNSESLPPCSLGCSPDNLRSWDNNAIINQAINRSLANGCVIYEGSLMSDGCRLSMASLDSYGTPSLNFDNSNEVEKCLVTSEAKEPEISSTIKCDQQFPEADGMAEREKRNFGKPRVSFLHGMKEGCKEPTSPSAVYSPASDLFITGSSNSSSSSDECEQSEGTLTETADKAKSDEASEELKSVGESNLAFISDHPEKVDCLNEEKNEIDVSYPTGIVNKQKPEIPEKPSKPHPKTDNPYAVPFAKPQQNASYGVYDNYAKTDGSVYYSVANETTNSRTLPLVSHYAESNIYQEIPNSSEITFDQEGNKFETGVERESKLAALAIELEQARCTNGNIKRQAPAPPKLSINQTDDSQSNTSRNPSPIDTYVPVQILRSDSIPFSSSSSTASTSSQDTDVGYAASWNLHSDLDSCSKNPRTHSSSKSKSSFLLSQYSKCKMLALGYVEDAGNKPKKKFSLKKLLKIGKESDSPTTFDPSYPNPKAWKYSENFDRPRAKLEIIHPMDLEDKNVTINPGFHSIHISSVGSYTSLINTDRLSNRISSFSDYDSISSDIRTNENPDSKPEVPDSSDYGIDSSNGQNTPGRNTPHSGNSGNSSPPSPSRLSTTSLSSNATSSSSRSGIPVRPPKPPPPPRAHSLLPGNRNGKSNSEVYKHTDSSSGSLKADEPESLPPKPQAPKRQYRQGVKSDYVNFEPKIQDNVLQVQEKYLQDTQTEVKSSASNSSNENMYEFVKNSVINEDVDSDNLQYQDVALPSVTDNGSLNKAAEKAIKPTLTIDSTSSVEALVHVENFNSNNHAASRKLGSSDINQKSLSTKMDGNDDLGCGEKIYQPSLQRNKHPPLTKAPSRPPPIYSKSHRVLNAKEKPWKSLEGSYAALASNNRDILIKLIGQGIKNRPNLFQEVHRTNLQWEDFHLDTKRPAVIFAFGDKVVYDAALACKADFLVTLVISIQQQSSGLSNYTQFKYPVLGHFNSCVPSNLLLLDHQEDNHENAMVRASVCVLHRAEVTTIENFVEGLSDENNEEQVRELCFILLQLIHGLKCLQAQGIEAIDASFQNLILAKTQEDNLHTLVFLSETFFDDVDNVYSSIAENCKVSLCQYALLLLCQLKKAQNTEALVLSAKCKNSSTSKIFENVVRLLMQEKAVSLSQAKTLLECYLWGIHTLSQDEGLESQDYDVILYRWIDIERSNFIKSVVGNSSATDFNSLDELHSQFLVRTNVRTIKEVLSFR